MASEPVASVRTREYDLLRALIRETREAKGISQESLSKSLGRRINYVGKVELGTRRLDVVELNSICEALSVEVEAFVAEWKKRL